MRRSRSARSGGASLASALETEFWWSSQRGSGQNMLASATLVIRHGNYLEILCGDVPVHADEACAHEGIVADFCQSVDPLPIVT